MTLIVALKTDYEVYLGSDSLAYSCNIGNRKFLVVNKYEKINEHVEILLSGILDHGRRFIEEMRRNLRGTNLESYDAFEVAKELEKVARPHYEEIVNIPSIKEALIKNKDILKSEWPLDIIVGGMNKDEDGDFTKPAIYELEVQHAFLFSVPSEKLVLGGAPDVIAVADPIFRCRLEKKDSQLSSPSKYKAAIRSCFEDVIEKKKEKLKPGYIVTISEPIHIARITKSGYESLM
ncbi:MAG: hypothetical protein QMC77_05055 [Methanocellales archaeon]|nr:hypothetical protein [Methanocellales archaeon]